MNLTPVKTPKLVSKLFPNYVWSIETDKKDLYLTFDDGPTPVITSWVLDTLKTFNAKATFFCIGKNIEGNPELFQRILEEGHLVGNHTQNHVNGWKTKTPEYMENVLKAENVLASHVPNFKVQQKLFRPPYGQIKPQQGSKILELGYKIIMWDVLSFDWDASVSEQECLNNVISRSKPGSIVVFHDSVKASLNMKYALPLTLEYFYKEGYEFKPLSF